VQKVPDFIKRVKAGETKLMGFGHRIYKNYDPRARIIKRVAYEVFELMGKNPLLEIALECERIALEDEYFVKRKLYPNVDFYTGLIYQSMGFPMTMFPVLFAIPRTSGWIAQWQEMLLDPEQKIARPRQIYLGHDTRDYLAMDKRASRRPRVTQGFCLPFARIAPRLSARCGIVSERESLMSQVPNSPSTASSRRRSQRVLMQISVRIHGLDAQGKPFDE